MVGARLAGASTWIVNEGSDAVAVPSVTVIVMRAEVPTFAAVGRARQAAGGGAERRPARLVLDRIGERVAVRIAAHRAEAVGAARRDAWSAGVPVMVGGAIGRRRGGHLQVECRQRRARPAVADA